MQTPNIQAIAYIAGIMDGEGTIALTRIHQSDPYRTPLVSVSSTSYEILDSCVFYTKQSRRDISRIARRFIGGIGNQVMLMLCVLEGRSPEMGRKRPSLQD